MYFIHTSLATTRCCCAMKAIIYLSALYKMLFYCFLRFLLFLKLQPDDLDQGELNVNESSSVNQSRNQPCWQTCKQDVTFIVSNKVKRWLEKTYHELLMTNWRNELSIFVNLQQASLLSSIKAFIKKPVEVWRAYSSIHDYLHRVVLSVSLIPSIARFCLLNIKRAIEIKTYFV